MQPQSLLAGQPAAALPHSRGHEAGQAQACQAGPGGRGAAAGLLRTGCCALKLTPHPVKLPALQQGRAAALRFPAPSA